MGKARFEHSLPDIKGGYANAQGGLPHFHTHIEILSPVIGRVEVVVGREEYELNVGDCAVVLPGTAHYHLGGSASNKTLFVVCSLKLTGEYAKLIQNSYAKKPVILKNNFHPDARYALQALTRDLENARHTSAEISMAHVKSLLHLFFTLTLPELALSDFKEDEDQNLTNKVLKYLSREYNTPIKLVDVADEFGISQYKLSRIFTNQLNTGFTQYLNALRVEHAKEALKNSDEIVTSIAHSCGFSSVRSFNRVFRQITGKTPSEYRQLQYFEGQTHLPL